jgi:parallel beta-helix repeat protein
VTLRGSGPKTVVSPPPKDSPLASANACAKGGNGICVTGTDKADVSRAAVESLTVSGFERNGIAGSETDRMRVSDVVMRDNGYYGFSQEKSTRPDLRGNIARDNGQAGIFIANSIAHEGGAIDTKGAVIRGNRLSGNRIGVVIRRARNATVEHNLMTGNCGGMFVVSDENKPASGKITIRRNQVIANNKFCPKTPRLDYIQGTGILLTGAEDSVVTANRVRGNVGESPLSGGIVLFHSFVGPVNVGNSVKDNVVLGNGPVDIAHLDTGTGNTFGGNLCWVSKEAGQC